MVYFDNAATTFPKPRSVASAVSRAVSYYGGNPGRGGHQISMRAAEMVYETRKKAAALFDAEVENTIFAMNCSHALNMAIKGILAGGGHAVTTCLEHNSVLRPLHALSKTGKISYSIADVLGNEDEIITALEQEIRPDTKVMAVTHASNVLGRVMPVERIATLCKRHGIKLIVDAAQTAGVLPIDLKKTGINILCMAGHKGLYGPTGTGLMLLHDTEPLHTLMEGGTGSVSSDLEQPDFTPDRYESGTVNTCGISGLSAGIDFVSQAGISKLYRREMALCRYVHRRLKQSGRIWLFQEELTDGDYVPIVLFQIPGMTSMRATELLNRSGFALRGGLHCAPLIHQRLETQESGAIRFSPGAFNTMEQAAQFVEKVLIISKNQGNVLELS